MDDPGVLPVVHEVCGTRHHEDQREPVAADLHGGGCLGGDQQLPGPVRPPAWEDLAGDDGTREVGG